LTRIISFQHARGGAGTSLTCMTSTRILSGGNRVALLEMDFLNPLLHLIFPQKTLKAYVNDFLFGEASLDDVLVDVSQDVNVKEQRGFMVGYMNHLEGPRRRMELADAARDGRIIKTLEKARWELKGEPLDFVLIDMPPWSNCLLDTVSVISEVIFFVMRPSRIELTVLRQRYSSLFSRIVAKIVPVINFYDPNDKRHAEILEEMKSGYPEFTEVFTLPYYQDLVSGPSKALLSDTSHPIYKDVGKALMHVFGDRGRLINSREKETNPAPVEAVRLSSKLPKVQYPDGL